MALLDLPKKQKSTDWKWTFADYPKEKNGLKVFSCFSCGGGSTMGYKLAGCEVLGNVEIDPKMNDLYKLNHNPKYNYCTDIRDFNNIPDDELPEELFNLDILDGSPPCTTFSMAGQREKSWGKKKKFREGQKEQTLDDLLFVFVDTVAKLKPKTVIMENVEGLARGNALHYLNKVYDKFKSIGYQVRCYLLKGEEMGVPQKRHRVFFIATKDSSFNYNNLDMNFNYESIHYNDIKCGIRPLNDSTVIKKLLLLAEEDDKSLQTVSERNGTGSKLFNKLIVHNSDILPTVTTHSVSARDLLDYDDRQGVSDQTIINASSFPRDYDFGKVPVDYVCGMSVPPIMTKRVVERMLKAEMF